MVHAARGRDGCGSVSDRNRVPTSLPPVGVGVGESQNFPESEGYVGTRTGQCHFVHGSVSLFSRQASAIFRGCESGGIRCPSLTARLMPRAANVRGCGRACARGLDRSRGIGGRSTLPAHHRIRALKARIRPGKRPRMAPDTAGRRLGPQRTRLKCPNGPNVGGEEATTGSDVNPGTAPAAHRTCTAPRRTG